MTTKKRSVYKNIHYNLIEKNDIINSKYQMFYNAHKGNKILSIPYALVLNITTHLFSRKNTRNLNNEPNKNSYPESNIVKRDSVKELVKLLSGFDTVSFDVFDTLVFRRLDNPKALFYIVGQKLNILDFYRIRVEAERDARKMSENPYGEIDIDAIYTLIANRCGISKEKGMETEMETEIEMCFPNPYMREVFESLIQMNKKILIVSNMYLTSKHISVILENCGYKGYKNLYVSCECGIPKNNGNLFRFVKKSEGKGKYIHVGDNFQADFEGARTAGWKSYYYNNVNAVGAPYRPANMSKIAGSVYSGIVNSKLHNGLTAMNPYYEFGYVYGGIIACGFCEWLNKTAAQDGVEHLLFAARDMKVIHKIYNKYYRKYDNDYILMSRYSALRFSYERISEYFVWAHVLSRANQKELTLSQVLREVGLGFLEDKLKNASLNADDILSSENYDSFKIFLESQKDYAVKYFKKETEAAKNYYVPFFEKKKVAVVDLGWQGTNALALKYFIEEKCAVNTQIYSYLVAAAGSLNMLAPYMESGVSRGCIFSPYHNRDLFNQHTNAGELRRLTMEIMFTSSDPSLQNFKKDKQSGMPIANFMSGEEERKEIIENIHAGIIDFADDFSYIKKRYNWLNFSPMEMYLPINKLLYKPDYIHELFSDFEINPWIGNNVKKEENKFSNYIKPR